MIKIENTKVYGWEAAIRGMRNPMNSWARSDSDCEFLSPGEEPAIGPNDWELAKRLCGAGTDHRKFMRMIIVYADITAPLYWWKEFDTYKVGTVANSCSTMHCIHKKEFTLDDFSHEQLILNYDKQMKALESLGEEVRGRQNSPLDDLNYDISKLNAYRALYLATKDKIWWWQMIQRLPSSYNQKRTIMLSYEVLANIYHSRKNHKLDEWHEFCDWIKTLPYSELVTGEEE